MLGFAAIGVSVASAILNIIGLAIPYWAYERKGLKEAYFGLWKLCYSKSVLFGVTSCVSYETANVGDALRAVRACELLGMLLILGTVLCFIMKQFVMKDKVQLPKIGAGLAIAAGIFMCIGCIVFAEDDEFNFVETKHLHAGFALCIVSGILGFIAAGIGFMIKE